MPKQWPTAPKMEIDPKKTYTAILHTDNGDITIHLHADKAPKTVNNFVFLARQGFYDGTIFHRVIANFMAQGGDPTGTGSGGPGYAFPDEIHPDLKHTRAGTLSMANAAWVNTTFNLRPEYVKLITDRLESEVQQLDFCQGVQAQETINGWVARKTGDRIRELIPQDAFTCDTRLMLTSAVYFLGEWADKFDPDKTAAAPFWVTPEQKVEAPLMRRQDEYFYTETAGWQVLEMPYRNENLSMVVLLPKGKKTLEEMEASLESVALEKLLRDLHWRQVTVSLPRFEIKLRAELSSALQRAGMIAAFGPQADFSGITTQEELFLNLVLHQTWVKVEERGTEATAATAVEIRVTAAPVKREPVVFRADHPFLFLIRDRQTGVILFWGRLINPQAG